MTRGRSSFLLKIDSHYVKKGRNYRFLLIYASYPSISGLSKIFKSIEKVRHYEGKSTERHEIGRSDSWKMGSDAALKSRRGIRPVAKRHKRDSTQWDV